MGQDFLDIQYVLITRVRVGERRRAETHYPGTQQCQHSWADPEFGKIPGKRYIDWPIETKVAFIHLSKMHNNLGKN